MFQGGAAWRKRLLDEIGDQGAVTRLIEARSDDELARLMNNLGGHDLSAIIEAFDGIDHDRPVCFIAYTIKGYGLPFAGHKDNHAGLMTPSQMETFRKRDGHPARPRMGPLRGFAPTRSRYCRRFSIACRSRKDDNRNLAAPRIAVPDRLAVTDPAGNVDAVRLRRAAQ